MGRQIVTFEAGSELKKIADSTFEGCTALRSITIPSEVVNIGSTAFNGCTALETVNFEAGPLKQIQWHTFLNCSSLKNIQIPEGVERIEREAFDGCTSLANVTLPASLNKAENIFSNCPNLTTVIWDIPRPTDNKTFCTFLESMLGVRPNCTVKIKDGTEFLCSATAGWYPK
ncbi:MAG: leucine-rich repeat domain-containing protein [Holosporales bacterium]|nr:leucine-rich repeat domain-containing protein [Holosporales bacterium]